MYPLLWFPRNVFMQSPKRTVTHPPALSASDPHAWVYRILEEIYKGSEGCLEQTLKDFQEKLVQKKASPLTFKA